MPEAIAGVTGLMDVTTGQFKFFGTPEYDAFKTSLEPELKAAGVTMDQYIGGGVGATLLNAASAYSSQFALENVNGGGTAWAQRIGGPVGYATSNRTSEAATAVTAPTVSNNPPPSGTNNNGTTNASDTPAGINWIAVGLLAGAALLVYKLMKG